MPFPSSALALRLPQKVVAGGVSVDLASFVTNPIPGYPGWQMAHVKSGVLLVVGWIPPSCVLPMSVDLFNLGSAPLHVVGSVKAGVNDFVIGEDTLSQYCGIAFTDGLVLSGFANSKASAPTDVVNALNKLFVTPDEMQTKDTGSANMEQFCSLAQWLANYGKTGEIVAALDSFRRFQVKRPRWWLDDQARPVPIMDPTAKIPGFGQWNLNVDGMNAWDEQHFDDGELYTMTRDLAWPQGLAALTQQWQDAKRLGPYWQETDSNTYAGSVRTFAWSMLASARLHDLYLGLGAAYDGLRAQVLSHIEWHVNHFVEKFPIASPWYYGSTPDEIKSKKLDYFADWQYGMVAFALFRVANTYATLKSPMEPVVRGAAEMVLDWLEAESYDSASGHVAYLRSIDGSVRVDAAIPGVGSWIAPAGYRSSKQRACTAAARSQTLAYFNKQKTPALADKNAVSQVAPDLFPQVDWT